MRLYPGKLCGWRHVEVEHVDGDWWKLHQNPDDPLRFVGRGNLVLTPPNKFVHDFGTIPRLARLLMGSPAGEPDFAQHAGKVYPIHDWAYEHQQWDDGTPLTRDEADSILARALDQVECAEWYVRLVYAAVRLGGAGYWNKHRTGHPSTYRGKP